MPCVQAMRSSISSASSTRCLNFCVNDLSAFYFDIRKDALYCDPYDRLARRAALTVLDQLFLALTAWLAPMLCFTMEEAWLNRFPNDKGSVHLRQFPEIPSEWRDEALAEKWRKVRALRRVVTGALEIERKEGRIGSSLEAAPKVYVADDELRAALQGVDLAEIAITSGIELLSGAGPEDAFRLARGAWRRCRVRAAPRARNARAPGRSCPKWVRTLSSLSFRRAMRRPCANSMHAARRPRSRAMARNWLWGPVSALGLGGRDRGPARPGNKAWMLHVYDIGARGTVTLTPFFDLVLVWNQGISYGLLPQEGALGRLGLILFALAASLALAIWLASLTSRLAAVAIGLIIGGAIGNAIDRVVYGAVADFFSFHAFGLDWYVFNIADTAIVAGVVGLLYDSLFRGHKKVGNPSKM